MLTKRYFTRNAGLGEEREWMGNLLRPILVEKVEQDWRAGEITNETSHIIESGRLALVIPAEGFSCASLSSNTGPSARGLGRNTISGR